MSEHSFVKLFGLIFISLSCIGVSSTEYVPVYMWETSQFSEVVPALERVSQESFRDIVVERAAKNTPILLFAEQNLSPEDFTLSDAVGETPFSKLSGLKSSDQISYWPSVKSPVKVVKELPDRTKVETDITSLLEDHDFVLHDNDVLVVDLNDAREGEDRVQMLKRHDEDIMAVYNRFVKEHKNIITLFSGYHSSWILPEELHNHRNAREAGKEPQANTTDTHLVYRTKDVLFYIKDVANLSTNGTIVSLTDFKMTSVETVNGTDVVFDSVTNPNIVIKLMFKFSYGYWSLFNVTVNDKNLPEKEQEYSLVPKDVYAPFRFSYHCFTQTFARYDNGEQNLTFPGLQMQIFQNETVNDTTKFGDAYDCVGFMSAPIWSGIFVTFILALIMTFGLTMMMDIKTMDRFDDPKGKTITITAAE